MITNNVQNPLVLVWLGGDRCVHESSSHEDLVEVVALLGVLLLHVDAMSSAYFPSLAKGYTASAGLDEELAHQGHVEYEDHVVVVFESVCCAVCRLQVEASVGWMPF